MITGGIDVLETEIGGGGIEILILYLKGFYLIIIFWYIFDLLGWTILLLLILSLNFNFDYSLYIFSES